jgi:hypothetical protein
MDIAGTSLFPCEIVSMTSSSLYTCPYIIASDGVFQVYLYAVLVEVSLR